MVSFLGADDRGVGYEGEVNTGVGYQVGLELGQIDVEGTIERREAVMEETIWPMRRFKLV